MPARTKTYRLVTRSDMDGLVCAVLLQELGMIDDIRFVHPKDVQDGIIDLTEDDITTNLPYVEGVHLAFDHHHSETVRVEGGRPNHIIDPLAPSATRVVYDHFGGRKAFPGISEEMLAAVDKADSAQYSMRDVLHPEGWELLSFLMDARTGLGRFHDFRISNYALMMEMIDYCRDHSIDEILAHPDVRDRVELYRAHEEPCKKQICRCARVNGDIAVLDFRAEETIYAGNRFMVYALFPECNISIHVLRGASNRNTVFAVGKSIFNRSSPINVGELMLQFGGGGHEAAGTCQVPHALAEETLNALIEYIAETRVPA